MGNWRECCHLLLTAEHEFDTWDLAPVYSSKFTNTSVGRSCAQDKYGQDIVMRRAYFPGSADVMNAVEAAEVHLTEPYWVRLQFAYQMDSIHRFLPIFCVQFRLCLVSITAVPEPRALRSVVQLWVMKAVSS